MTTSRNYTLLVPRLDRTGPCNVAVDIGQAAAAAGWTVTLLFLSGDSRRDDLAGFAVVRRFRLSDVIRLRGVVHTHCLRPDLVGALLTWNRRCVVLTTLHNYFLIDLGFDHRRWQVRLAWFFWKHAIARMHRRVCISNAMRRYYRRLLPGQTFELAYNFRPSLGATAQETDADISRWMTSQRSAGRICLAYVGSLSQRKNLLALIQAIARSPELALVVCGQGPLRPALEQAIAAQHVSDRVALAGQVAQPAAVLAVADLLVLPSHAEGLPLVVIEAARLGVPSLLSNIAVHRELAVLGLGLTFDRHGFKDLSLKARQLANRATPAFRREVVALWQEHFSPEVGFARYQRLIEA